MLVMDRKPIRALFYSEAHTVSIGLIDKFSRLTNRRCSRNYSIPTRQMTAINVKHLCLIERGSLTTGDKYCAQSQRNDYPDHQHKFDKLVHNYCAFLSN